MPISQPPAGKLDTLTDKPGSVGIPVAASTAIVSRATLRPQPPGVEGEIAISGLTVMKHYLENPEADMKSFFHLTLTEDYQRILPYFLTGDVGKCSAGKLKHNIIFTLSWAILRCNR